MGQQSQRILQCQTDKSVEGQKEIQASKQVVLSSKMDPLKKASFSYIKPLQFDEQVIQGQSSIDSQIQQLNSFEETKISKKMLESIKQIKFKWNSTVKVKEKNYLEDYEIKQNVIGRGTFGVVRSVVCKLSKKLRIAKMMRKKLMKEEDVVKIFKQLAIMSSLDHPNIVKLYQIYDYDDIFTVVMQMCTGGEVHSKTKRKCVPEKTAGNFIKQVLKGLVYMHSKNIIHRDIKPHNMMFQHPNKKNVKLIDFGISERLQSEDQFLSERIGTPHYIAPELIKKHYNQKIDVWALGVSMYQLLCGKLPFSGSKEKQIFANILRDEPNYEQPAWKSISQQCKSVVNLMLTKKMEQRPSAKELYEHSFFSKINLHKSTLIQSKDKILNNLKNFQFKNKLQIIIQTFIASQLLTQKEKENLIGIFHEIDQNNDGVISAYQLRKMLKTKKQMSKQRIEQILKVVDINGSGQIDYTEFIVANFQSSFNNIREKLHQVFQLFDTDKDGSISINQVRQFLANYDESEQQIQNLFKDVDQNGDGSISQEQFINLILDKVSSFVYVQDNTEVSTASSKVNQNDKSKQKEELLLANGQKLISRLPSAKLDKYIRKQKAKKVSESCEKVNFE